MRISDWSSDVCSSDLHRPALLAFQRQTILCGQETVLGLQRRGKAQRAGLRHAPGLSQLHPLVVKSTDHDGWYRRPADDHPLERGNLFGVAVNPIQEADRTSGA